MSSKFKVNIIYTNLNKSLLKFNLSDFEVTNIIFVRETSTFLIFYLDNLN